MMNESKEKTAHGKKWFEVDPKGFRIQCLEIGVPRLVAELISNVFDLKEAKNCWVNIEQHGEIIHVTVKDDGDGFKDKNEIFIIFGDSDKRDNPELRGRFNYAEKQFVVLCEEAHFRTGNWHIAFKGAKRIEKRHDKKFEGTEIFGRIRDSTTSKEKILEYLYRIAVPAGKTLTINGTVKPTTPIVKKFRTKLPTPIAKKGYNKLREVIRETEIYLYELQDFYKTDGSAEPAWLYEMGIPICKLDDNIRWHVDVQQKVPQVPERNVIKTPAYLKAIYTAVAENCLDIITEDDASETWVSDALEKTTAETSTTLMEKRYGTDKIAIEGTDTEANERALRAGYKLIGGGELNRDIKSNLKTNNLIDYASNQFGTSGWETAKAVEETPAMTFFAKICKAVAKETIRKDITVSFVTTKHTDEGATYGNRHLQFNVRNCGGKKHFENTRSENLLGLLIHELAHDRLGNNDGFAHLSHDYLREQEKVAGKCFSKGIDYFITLCRGKSPT